MKFRKLNLQHTDRELLEIALEALDKGQHYFKEDDDQRLLRQASHCVRQLDERLAKIPIQEKGGRK